MVSSNYAPPVKATQEVIVRSKESAVKRIVLITPIRNLDQTTSSRL